MTSTPTEDHPKIHRIAQIVLSFAGIYGSFITSAYFGEKMMTRTFVTKPGKPDPIIITIIAQNFLSFLLAFIVNRVLYKRKSPLPFREQLKMGTLNFCSVLLSLKTLNYLTTPVANLVKASKSMSILLVSLIYGKAVFDASQFTSVSFVTAGILVFNILQDSKPSHIEDKSTGLGYLLAISSLVFDGFIASVQNNARKLYKIQAFDLMQDLNLWGAVLATLYGISTGEIMPSVRVLSEDTWALGEFGLLIMTGIIGQVFIFYTIVKFSPLFLSIVTSSRKFFSVALSIFMFNHKVNFSQWFGILLVFAGVAVEVYQKAQETPPANVKPQTKKAK